MENIYRSPDEAYPFLAGMMIISYRTLVPVFRPALADIAVSMVYIIDAGHGGEDGGACSEGGASVAG